MGKFRGRKGERDKGEGWRTLPHLVFVTISIFEGSVGEGVELRGGRNEILQCMVRLENFVIIEPFKKNTHFCA